MAISLGGALRGPSDRSLLLTAGLEFTAAGRTGRTLPRAERVPFGIFGGQSAAGRTGRSSPRIIFDRRAYGLDLPPIELHVV